MDRRHTDSEDFPHTGVLSDEVLGHNACRGVNVIQFDILVAHSLALLINIRWKFCRVIGDVIDILAHAL